MQWEGFDKTWELASDIVTTAYDHIAGFHLKYPAKPRPEGLVLPHGPHDTHDTFMVRAAGGIARDQLPPLNTMIQIVRTEVGARSLENDRQGGKSRSVNATFQDNGDAKDADPPSFSEKRLSATSAKRRSKNRREAWMGIHHKRAKKPQMTLRSQGKRKIHSNLGKPPNPTRLALWH